MSWRPCLACGTLVLTGSYCTAHLPKRASRQTAGRGGGTAASRFRALVLNAAGHQCEVIENGARCTATTGLEAHHVVCREHHKRLEKNVF